MEKNSAIKAGMGYVIGNMLLKGVIFITLPIFTRLMATRDYGYYNTYVAYETIITGIIGLGLYGSIKNAKLDFKEKFEEYLSCVITIGLIALTVLLAVGLIMFNVYEPYFGFNKFVLICLMLHSYGSFVIQVYNAKLNMEFKYKSFIIIAFINTFSNIIISILLITGLFSNERYLGRIIGYAFPPIIIGFILTVNIIHRGKKCFNKSFWKYGLIIGVPLIPHVLSQTVLSQFDRVMIQNIVGPSEAGIYSFMYTISTILYIVHTSLDSAWTPWVFYRIDLNNEDEIKEKSSYYIFVFVALTIGFMCVIPEIIKIMASKSYWLGMNLMVPLSLCIFCMFIYTLAVNIEYYHKKTFYISLGTMSAAVVDVVLNYFCISKWGYELAAYTTLFSYILLCIFHINIANRYGFKKYYSMKDIRMAFAAVAIIGSIIRLSSGNILIRYGILVILFIVFWFKRRGLFDILKTVRNK